MVKRILILYIFSLLMLANLPAQTRLNPDISLVGDMRVFSRNDTEIPAEKEKFNLAAPRAELVIAGYLNPYARADAVVAWEEGNNAAIEEVYASILRGLPLNMNLRVGKYRLEFGRLNPVHPHAYSFIYLPLPHEEFFGEEGLNDVAIRPSFLIPTGNFYTEVMGAVLKGDALLSEEDAAASDTGSTSARIKPGFFGRITTSTAVSEFAEFSLGMSFVTSHYDPGQQLRAWIYGFDLKYKWKPNRNTSLTLEGEGLGNRREKIEGSTNTSYGGYGYIDYRFRQKYNLGSIFEYTQGKLDNQEHTWRNGLFVGFAPIEETSLVRLVGDWTKPKDADGFWTVTVQLVFSLGPHQPHNF